MGSLKLCCHNDPFKHGTLRRFVFIVKLSSSIADLLYIEQVLLRLGWVHVAIGRISDISEAFHHEYFRSADVGDARMYMKLRMQRFCVTIPLYDSRRNGRTQLYWTL